MAWIILAAALVCLTLAVIIWLGGDTLSPGVDAAGGVDASTAREPLRIGLIPERDIFEQRRRYEALASYIASVLGRPVELVTNNTYEGVLDDFATGQVDAAFLGSFVAVLAMDRYDARVLVKPETPAGVTTYRSVLFTRADAPIGSIEELAGRSIAMVKATTAGDLFPIHVMVQGGLLDAAAGVDFRWVGTHDAAIQEVVEGRTDAGAAKDLRLIAYEQSHPVVRLRRLEVGPSVPNNALFAGALMPEELAEGLATMLTTMHDEPAGRTTLETFGAGRFVPCEANEYEAIYQMVEGLGDDWSKLGVSGPPPRPPESPVVRGGT
jgi:phosphonate transport system substrate-binding protein